ncbi:MAG: hypothetical protein ABFR65_07110 [Pseudomonadota bacterium]
MTRIISHSLCLFLAAVTGVQADAYRYSSDRDDGFNPMNVMQEMPNPMGMLDASDRRRDERRHRPPPPPPVPAYPYGYGRPPAYAPPPAGQSPYGYPRQPAVAPTHNQTLPSDRPTPPVPAAPRSTFAKPAPEKPAMAQDQQHRSENYSFRPMTPMQPDMETAAPTANPASGATPTSNWPGTVEPTPPPNPDTATSSRRTLPPVTEKSDDVMVNGKPAVFRPMNLGVESPSQ